MDFQSSAVSEDGSCIDATYTWPDGETFQSSATLKGGCYHKSQIEVHRVHALSILSRPGGWLLPGVLARAADEVDFSILSYPGR